MATTTAPARETRRGLPSILLKTVMAVTGLFFVFYLLLHMYGNLQILVPGPGGSFVASRKDVEAGRRLKKELASADRGLRFEPGALAETGMGEHRAAHAARPCISEMAERLRVPPEVLEPTYGVITYQEQVMRIANVLAGFSLAEADVLRKAVGKKDADLIRKELGKFIEKSVVVRQLCRTRSSGVCGAPWRLRYAGLAHTTRRLGASLRAASEESAAALAKIEAQLASTASHTLNNQI